MHRLCPQQGLQPHQMIPHGTWRLQIKLDSRFAWTEFVRLPTRSVKITRPMRTKEENSQIAGVSVLIRRGIREDLARTQQTEHDCRRCRNKHDDVNRRATNIHSATMNRRKPTRSNGNGSFDRCTDSN